MIKNDKFVYIHVPRTAGCTAEDLFHERHGLTYHYQHNTVRDLEAEDYSKFIFGFIRNPYSQEYSCWKLHCVDTDWPKLTFREWIKLRFDNGIEELKEKFLKGTKKRRDHINMCLEYATKFCINGQLDFFKKDDKIIASKIYQFENLKESWNEISDNIGLDMRFETHALDITYKTVYNNYTYDVVTKVKHSDLKHSSYTFDA